MVNRGLLRTAATAAFVYLVLLVLPAFENGPANAFGVALAQSHGGGGGGGHGGGGGGHTDGGHTDGDHTDDEHVEGGHDGGAGQRGRRFGSHGGSRGPGHLDRGGPSPGHSVESRVFHRPDSDVEEHGHTDHEDGEDHEEGVGGPRD